MAFQEFEVSDKKGILKESTVKRYTQCLNTLAEQGWDSAQKLLYKRNMPLIKRWIENNISGNSIASTRHAKRVYLSAIFYATSDIDKKYRRGKYLYRYFKTLRPPELDWKSPKSRYYNQFLGVPIFK